MDGIDLWMCILLKVIRRGQSVTRLNIQLQLLKLMWGVMWLGAFKYKDAP